MGTDQIYESSTPSYCCIQNWSGGGTGNIDADPCFVEAGHWDPNGTPGNKSDDFWVDGDYHLLPLSPCIDAGDPNYPDDPNKRDIDGEARIINGRIDIGADEYSFGELSDFSGDGIVNFNDLAILAYYWADSLCTSPDWCEGCDYDQSGTVDLEDLMRFAEDWLWQDESSDTNNHAPVLEAIGNKSVNENTLLTFTISATDADGDTLTYSATNLPSGATFVGQTFYWTPSYTQAGTYSVTFRASDGNAQDSETITITVNNTNRAPVLAAIGNKSVNENSTLSFSINATDADGDTITYSAQDLPSGAAFAGRIFSWTPGYTQAGTYEVNFIASDGQAQDSEEITITVNNVNQAPILSPIGNKSAFANDLLAFSVSATESDGDTITYSATGLPSGATFTSQSFIWTPTPSQVGTYTVTFIASDGQLQDSEEITITVYSADMSAPTVNILSPAADSIQVPLNNLVILHIEKTDTQLTI
jgi:PKD repeat protein